MEGIAVSDRQGLSDDSLLGIDLTEYYNGDTFDDATSIGFSQLKYSTRHPERAWTAARLGEHSGNKASVIHRLAQILAGHKKKYGRQAVADKLVIRLVSNQPADSSLVTAIDEARAWITTANPSRTADLLKHATAQSKPILRRLYEDSKVGSEDFIDFLRVLELSDCGSGSRELLRTQIIQQLGLSTGAPSSALDHLYLRIRDEALPERKHSNGLTKQDVLAALGRNEESLFPARPYFKSPDPVIDNQDISRLADAIQTPGSHYYVVHGDAGVGKTTSILALRDRLPEGSELLAYDCFGAGSYRDLGEERHTLDRCLTELTNELAVIAGSPFMVSIPNERTDVARFFKRALHSAAQVVEKAGGLLVLVIDAADNAVIAGKELGEGDSFVPHLWRTELPSNCCLLMTCRTHRQDLLRAPGKATPLELRGFDEAATAEFVRVHIPDATDALCVEIYRRTSGIPRFLAYLLDRLLQVSDGGAEEIAQFLTASTQHALKDLFDDIVNAATAESADPPRAPTYIANLLCLARPVRLDVFADVCGLSGEQAQRFVRGLTPGLELDQGQAAFRDEEFENHLRSVVSDDQLAQAHGEIAGRLLAHASTDPYAAAHIANHLYQAGRFTELIDLALNGPEPTVISDDVERLHTQMRRFGLALDAAVMTGDTSSAARLLILAADAKKTSDAVRNLVREYPHLAALHGDLDRVARLYLDSHLEDVAKPWLGAAHLQVASLYARNPNQHTQAIDQLDSASAWFRLRNALDQNERHSWKIEDKDIASGAEAIFWLSGAKAAVRWLLQWRPYDSVLRAAHMVLVRLAPSLTSDQARELLVVMRPAVPCWVEAFVVSALWSGGCSVPDEIIDDIAARLDRLVGEGFSYPKELTDYKYPRPIVVEGGWAVTFCEVLANRNIDSERTMRILAGIGPAAPTSTPRMHMDLGEWDAPLRSACLVAQLTQTPLALMDLLPAKYRKVEGSDRHQMEYESERRTFSDLIGPIFPLYVVRAQSLCVSTSVQVISEELKSRMASSLNESAMRGGRFSATFEIAAMTAWDAIRFCADLQGDGQALSRYLIVHITGMAERAIRGGAADFWIRFARRVSRSAAHRTIALNLLERAAGYVAEHPVPARDRWNSLMQCADVALPHDEALCTDFYRRALLAAADIDDESVPLLRTLTNVAHSLSSSVSISEQQDIAARLPVIVSAHRQRVSEPDKLPWGQLVRSVTALDERMGTALCYQLDHDGYYDLDDAVGALVAEQVASNKLDPMTALGVLHLSPAWYSQEATYFAILDRLAATGASASEKLVDAVSEISLRIRRDVPLDSRKRAAQNVLDWTDRHRVPDCDGIVRLRELVRFTRQLETNGRGDESADVRRLDTKEAEADTSRRSELQMKAQTGDISDLGQQIEEAWRLDYREGIHAHLTALAEAVEFGKRSEFLSAIVRDGFTNSFLSREILRFLTSQLERWKHSPRIRGSVPGLAQTLFLEQLPQIVGSGYQAQETLNEALQIPGFADVDVVSLLVTAARRHLDVLTSEALYIVCGNVLRGLPSKARCEVVVWELDRLESHLKITRESRREIAAATDSVLAELLWMLLGHPNSVVRWQAVHAVRFAVHYTGASFLGTLVELSHFSGPAPGFSTASVFHWMTARVYLLLALQRLSKEMPALLVGALPALIAHVLNPDFPHAQARAIARMTVLELSRLYPDRLTAETLQQIEFANQPRSCFAPRRNSYDGRASEHHGAQVSHAGKRFTFDSLDVIPYWFDPAARVFHLNTADFTRMAERWVTDQWKFTDTDWQLERDQVGDRYPWEDTSVSHGSRPKVETLRTYLEVHAMQCVAGELVDTKPISIDTYDYDEDHCPWRDWLQSYLPGSEDRWAADLRTTTPLRAYLWKEFSNSQDWPSPKSVTDYDSELGLDEADRQGWMVVYGSISIQDYGRSAGSHVQSALVAPEMASSLMHALQTTDSNNYALPVTNRWSDAEINDAEFVLVPFLVDLRGSGGLDDEDPAAKDVPTSEFTSFGQDFLDVLALTDLGDSSRWRSPDGTVVAYRECWSDDPKLRHRSPLFSVGHRLWVRVDSVLRYLQAKDQDLILEVRLSRNLDYDHRKSEDIPYDLGTAILYILRRDGTFHTMAGRRQLGS